MITHGLPHWLQKELDVLDTLSGECEAESLDMYLGTFTLNALINGKARGYPSQLGQGT